MQVLAVKVEFLVAFPKPANDLQPFLAIGVAGIMFAVLDTEHVELVLVPSTDNVHAHAAASDQIGGRQLFGGNDGMDQRRVDRREHADALGIGKQARRPDRRLQNRAVEIGFAAIAFPASDRQHEIDARFVGHLRQLQVVFPTAAPAFRHFGGRTSRRTIRGKKAELEFVVVVERRAILLRCRQFRLPGFLVNLT